jgi:hypothetical protein
MPSGRDSFRRNRVAPSFQIVPFECTGRLHRWRRQRVGSSQQSAVDSSQLKKRAEWRFAVLQWKGDWRYRDVEGIRSGGRAEGTPSGPEE